MIVWIHGTYYNYRDDYFPICGSGYLDYFNISDFFKNWFYIYKLIIFYFNNYLYWRNNSNVYLLNKSNEKTEN